MIQATDWEITFSFRFHQKKKLGNYDFGKILNGLHRLSCPPHCSLTVVFFGSFAGTLLDRRTVLDQGLSSAMTFAPSCTWLSTLFLKISRSQIRTGSYIVNGQCHQSYSYFSEQWMISSLILPFTVQPWVVHSYTRKFLKFKNIIKADCFIQLVLFQTIT